MASLHPELRAALARLTADLSELTRALENSSLHQPKDGAPFADVPPADISPPRRKRRDVRSERLASLAKYGDGAESEESDEEFPLAEQREKILRETLPDEHLMKELRDAFLLGILDERPEAERTQPRKFAVRGAKVGKRTGKRGSDEDQDSLQLGDWFNGATIQVDNGSSRNPRRLVTVLTSEPWILESAGPQDPINTTKSLGRSETAVRREIVKRIREIWPKTLGDAPIPADSVSGGSPGSDGATDKESSKHKNNGKAGEDNDDDDEDDDQEFVDDENAFWELDALPERILGTHYTVTPPKQGEEAKPPTDLGTLGPPRIDMLPAQGRLW